MDSWLSIAGSVTSIGGACWACYQAKLSAQHAGRAEVVRDELIKRREMVEISQVHSETARILKVVSKVGPTCTNSSICGVNCSEIAKEVEEYSRYLNEQSSHSSEPFGNEARILCSDLNQDIESLSEAKEFDDIKTVGKSIYYKINNFMPKVKRLTDERKESKPNVYN